MARVEDICSVPGCTREIYNHKRGLCRPCTSSMYYWKRRQKETQGKALGARQQQLSFWSGRLDWMYQPAFSKTGPLAERADGDQS